MSLIDSYVFANMAKNNMVIQRLVFIFISLFFIFFVGFRENCGFDYDSYDNLFQEFSKSSLIQSWRNSNIELGYIILNIILGNFKLLLFSMALITITLQFLFIYKYSPLPFLSLFLLLGVMIYPSIMGQYRQALAVSIMCWAFISKDNKIKFFFLLIIAMFFHTSALFGVIVLLIPDNKLLSLWLYLIIMSLALLINFFVKQLFVDITNYLPGMISERVDYYSETDDYIVGFNAAMVMRIVVFLIFYYFRKEITSYPKGTIFFNLYFVSLFIYLGFGFLPQISLRAGYYFYIFEFILTSMLLFRLQGPTKFILFMFFVGIGFYRQFVFFSDWSLDYIPYQNSLIDISSYY